jgi:hypothetical protein
MKRREMMKLAYLAIVLPTMPSVAQANSENEAPPLRYKVFTVTRPGRSGDIPLDSIRFNLPNFFSWDALSI